MYNSTLCQKAQGGTDPHIFCELYGGKTLRRFRGAAIRRARLAPMLNTSSFSNILLIPTAKYVRGALAAKKFSSALPQKFQASKGNNPSTSSGCFLRGKNKKPADQKIRRNIPLSFLRHIKLVVRLEKFDQPFHRACRNIRLVFEDFLYFPNPAIAGTPAAVVFGTTLCVTAGQSKFVGLQNFPQKLLELHRGASAKWLSSLYDPQRKKKTPRTGWFAGERKL